MEVLLIPLILLVVLSGPVSLIVSIVALNKINRISARPVKRREELREPKWEQPVEAVRQWPPQPVEVQAVSEEEEKVKWQRPVAADKSESTKAEILEQRIGTKWILIAGVITVIVGVGFFLKYAYDNALIGPLGRVVIAAVSGIIALGAGEKTRQRGYGIVAKGVTALGFAILYAAVFSAYRFYGLIGSIPAFALSILITASAMFYAVSLNEIIIAFLCLLGGFATPAIVSTGENLPVPLFSYVLVLSIGAILCAYYRKWRAVNVLAFIGTFTLYTGWFEKFYRPEIIRGVQEGVGQMPVALGWLTVFFGIYLVMPTLYGLVKRVKAQREDVLLILANAAVTFYYLWTILFAKYRVELAFCSLAMCLAHLIMMSIVTRRYADDLNLRLVLLVVGLFFLTIAIPLYLKMYAVAMAWAAEGGALAIIGLRYRDLRTQFLAAIAFGLSLVQLFLQLPMHKAVFYFVFNPAFGTWCFVVGVLFLCHILYRRTTNLGEQLRAAITEVLYGAALLLLMAAVIMEWDCHCEYNLQNTGYLNKGVVVIFAAIFLLLIARPLCPRGMICKILAMALATIGSFFTMIAFADFYKDKKYLIFANSDFGIVVLFVAALFFGALLLRRAAEEDEYNAALAKLFAVAGIFVLWVLMTEEIYFYWCNLNKFSEGRIVDWRFLALMYMSVMWALYGAILIAIGFFRKITMLRYIALGLFALLLAKVFIFDTSEVKSVYRIAAFLATGITLVGVSYLYQFLKKKGFFEEMLTGKSFDK